MAKLTKVNFKISIPDEFELDEKKGTILPHIISKITKKIYPSFFH